MKKSNVGEIITRYIPEVFNEYTNEWIDVEEFKKPYTRYNDAKRAIERRIKYCHDKKTRIRIETMTVTNVSYDEFTHEQKVEKVKTPEYTSLSASF